MCYTKGEKCLFVMALMTRLESLERLILKVKAHGFMPEGLLFSEWFSSPHDGEGTLDGRVAAWGRKTN